MSGAESVLSESTDCDWFVASSHEFDENKQLDHESTMNFLSLTNVFYSYFIKAIDHSSCSFYW